MPKAKHPKTEVEASRRLKHPWPVVYLILFFVVVAGMVVFAVYGFPTAVAGFTRGYIGVTLQTDQLGRIVLTPSEDSGAASAGVEAGDILVAVDGQYLGAGIDPFEMLRGRVGEPVSITVLKPDNTEATYTIVRSQHYAETLRQAGLSVDVMAGYFIGLSLLLTLAFIVLGSIAFFHRPQDGLFVLAAYALLLLPVSLNMANVVSNGAAVLNVPWILSLLRVIGLFMLYYLALVFPDGRLHSDWARLALMLMGIWLVPYFLSLIVEGFLTTTAQLVIWVILFLMGAAVIAHRFFSVSTKKQRWQTRPLLIAAATALGAYLLVIGLGFLPETTFSEPGWVWYYLIAELPFTLGLLYVGINLVCALRRI
ncbi:MAG: PDZ domain-containing protein [Anaerolineales bacterium]